MPEVLQQPVSDKVALARILRAGDLVALALTVNVTFEFCTRVLGIWNPLLLMIIGAASLRAAVSTLTAYRRGRLAPRSLDFRGVGAAPLLAGSVIFAGLQLLRQLDPVSALWQPLTIPAGARLGIAALLVLVPMALRIRRWRAEAPDSEPTLPPMSRNWPELASATVMLSGGVAAAALAVTAFVPLNWLRASRSANADLPPYLDSAPTW